MELLKTTDIHCPYCGEIFDINVDCSIDFQQYVEDCQICCRPITMSVSVNQDLGFSVGVQGEDD